MHTYLSYKGLHSIIKSLAFHRNKLKLRLYNTNPPFASQQAVLGNNSKAIKAIRAHNYHNVTPLRTDYIAGKATPNNKVELIIHLDEEQLTDAIEILNIARDSQIIDSSRYNQLKAYITEGL